MKRNLLKILLVVLLAFFSAITLVGCDMLGGDEGDANLYHLVISSNIELSAEQKNELKVIYGYGNPGLEAKEGIRPEEEIEDLKNAGATDADIAKAGKRQADGSYYFFAQDPLYITYPEVEGYKLDGYFYKGTNELAYRPIVSKGPDQTEPILARWNMDDKDVELIAKYEKCIYEPAFIMANGDINPNDAPRQYSFIDNGHFELQDPISANEHKKFDHWVYSTAVDGQLVYTETDCLPHNYEETFCQIIPIWNYDKFTINFSLETYIDPDTKETPTWEDAIESISIKGNLTTVAGQTTVQDVVGGGDGVNVTNESEILTPYVQEDNGNPWIEIIVKTKPGYKLWKYGIEGTTLYDTFYEEMGYFTLYASDFVDAKDKEKLINEAIIKLVFTQVVE